jgi:iron complex outermembrane receptor protein
MSFRLAALFASVLLPCQVQAQPTDTLTTLPNVEVEAARTSVTEASAPFALSALRRDAGVVALEPGLSLDALLSSLPGLWVNDRSHFALGERLSVRGMGSRAAFGVRGVQVLLDGLPLTMADGQSVTDGVDPALVRRAELIRGPAARYWGNGSGGVLFLSTLNDHPAAVRVRAVQGGYDTRHLLMETTWQRDQALAQVFASDQRQAGYRAYSAGRFTRVGGHLRQTLHRNTRLHLTAAFTDQDTENPGALTREEWDQNPRLADPRNVEAAAGKRSRQAQGGTTLLQQTRRGLASATAWGLTRSLDNPLSFAYVQLDRRAGGLRLLFQQPTWGVGLDATLLRDARTNRDNLAGQPGAERTLHQTERVRNLATFGTWRLPLPARLALALGARADHLRFALDDHLLTNGDQTGTRTFSALSPALGLTRSFPDGLAYAHYSTAFETPTTTELVNRPDLTGGFNPDLEPQRVRGAELGARGIWQPFSYDLAFFRLHVRDLIVPFQTPEGGGRTFFRNQGNSRHSGAEVVLGWLPHPGWMLQLSYSGGRFVFTDASLRGNRLPGVPPHRLHAQVEARRNGWRMQLAAEAVSRYFVDDANTTANPGYSVVDLSAGHTGLTTGRLRLLPLLRISNLFDVAYAGSVIVNAQRGRFFEPSPGRTVQAGLNVQFDR